MAGQAPSFWWTRPNWQSCVLAPIACVYGTIAGRRLLKSEPPKVAAPVLCIGNFTVGGAGKTPTAIAFAKAAKKLGLNPGIVSRGYGGNYKGLHIVDPVNDSARHVGDEPLLLARHAPVALSPDRLKSAQELCQNGCDFIIMDDGFQSARLYADFSLLVVDSTRGIGNGKVIPAGPLRAPLIDQMRKTDAVLRIGKGRAADYLVRQAARAARPIFDAQLLPSSQSIVKSKNWLAFAGIGNPDKFYASVREAGGEIIETRSFADHHAYTVGDVEDLRLRAQQLNVGLITTAKDQVRLITMQDGAKAFVKELTILDIELDFDRDDAVGIIMSQTIDHFKQRQPSQM